MEREENHIYFMQRAIALAKKGAITEGGGPFGAVVVKNNQILAEAFNEVKGKGDCTQHAELAAIQKACAIMECDALEDCILYTSCEPCMMCLGASHWSGFRAIYYGASAADAKAFGYVYSDMYYSSDMEERHSEFNMKQLLSEQAIKVWESQLETT
ncbi:nucleoside deaminase [Aquimarina sp. 2-A2]|uniref:nucleoside deaminase n=1 Tax=Aquimarina sp. 2-A2 TaxID=3382644 RepID=UPI00387F187F